MATETAPLLVVESKDSSLDDQHSATPLRLINLEKDQEKLKVILGLVRNIKEEMDEIEQRLGGRLVTRKPKPDPFLRPWLVDRLLLFSFLWQLLSVVAVEVLSLTLTQTYRYYLDIAVIIMAVFQALQLVLVMITSVKMVKQMVHRTVSAWFLAQSFLSSVMLFAGIYTIIYRLNPSAFYGVLVPNGNAEISNIILYVNFLCFSTGAMSTGISNIFAIVWYAQLLVIGQELLSVLYWTAILGYGLDHWISGETDEVVSADEKSVSAGRNIQDGSSESKPTDDGKEPDKSSILD